MQRHGLFAMSSKVTTKRITLAQDLNQKSIQARVRVPNKVNASMPAFVVHWTDYSPGRASPLDREVKLAPTLEVANEIADQLVEANIKKGWEKGDQYTGEWKNNHIHGQGTFTYADGDKYEGEWKDDKMHGQGTYTFINGKKIEGIWENGKKVEVTKT